MKESRSKGFTLIELMVVIAILAILAAVAITSFQSYQKKAKAKELITIARGCAEEVISKCIEDSSFNPENNYSSLDSCSGYNSTKYLTEIDVNVQGTSCSGDITVTAKGKVGNDMYKVTCTYNATAQDISCTTPTPTS